MAPHATFASMVYSYQLLDLIIVDNSAIVWPWSTDISSIVYHKMIKLYVLIAD